MNASQHRSTVMQGLRMSYIFTSSLSCNCTLEKGALLSPSQICIDFTVTAFVERQIVSCMLHLKAVYPLITLLLCLHRSTAVLWYLLEETAFTSIFPEADRKNKYKSKDCVGRKAQRGADFDSPDLFRFSLKKLRKWKSRASI